MKSTVRSGTRGNWAMRPLFASLLFSVVASHALADTIEWTDPNSGNFNDPNNWTVTAGAGSPPPGVGDEVFFNENEMATYTITLTVDEAVDRILHTAGEVTLLSNKGRRLRIRTRNPMACVLLRHLQMPRVK